MADAYAKIFWDVAHYLVVAGIAYFAWNTAREAARKHGRWFAVGRGLGWCAGIAFVAALFVGQPSCDGAGDPLHGDCEITADDGFNPTFDQRANRFLFWVLLLGVPVLIGGLDEGLSKYTRRRN